MSRSNVKRILKRYLTRVVLQKKEIHWAIIKQGTSDVVYNIPKLLKAAKIQDTITNRELGEKTLKEFLNDKGAKPTKQLMNPPKIEGHGK